MRNILERHLATLAKIVPAVGLVLNKLRFPKLHFGVGVEVSHQGRIEYGKDVRIGGLTRIYLGPAGVLQLGDNVGLGRDVHIQTEGRISIGAGTGLNDRSRLYGSVQIGRGCAVGANLNVSSGHHVFRSPEPWLTIKEQERLYPGVDAPVDISDDCWIGINVVILPGISVGKGSIVGANSVVTKDVKPYTIVAGVPARQIGERLAFHPPTSINAARREDRPYFYAGFGDPDHDTTGLVCDPDFVIALEASGAETGVIELTGTSRAGGTFSSAGGTVDVPAGAFQVQLPVKPEVWQHKVSAIGDFWIATAQMK